MPLSLLWTIQHTLVELAYTPMLPPPPSPPTVELTPVDCTASAPFSLQASSFASSSPSTQSSSSARSSFEIDASAAPAVRDMISAATRDTLT